MSQGQKNRTEIDAGNIIEYDVKSLQVKTAIVKCTKVPQKVLKLNRSQKEIFVYSTYT